MNQLDDVNTTHITYAATDGRRAEEIPRRLTNLVPSGEANIIGREAELADTYRCLHTGQPAVLVNGVGGMGKSTLAAKYVARYFEHYRHVAWLTVQGSLRDAFLQNQTLLDALHLDARVRELINVEKQPAAAFDLVLKKLNDLEKTLVVLDNANALEDLLAHKKRFDTAGCHFLLTSRARPEGWQVVDVGPLPEAEAVALFGMHYRAAAPADGVAALLARLDRHTLLIELIAKSAAASGIPFDALQGIVRDKFIHHPDLNKRRVDTGAHGDSLDDNAKRAKVEEYVWLIFENITELFDGEKELLRAFALLPPATAFDEDFLEKHARLWDLEAEVFSRLDRLAERGWLEREQPPGQPPRFKMHPIVADVALRHLQGDAAFAAPYLEAVTAWTEYDNTNPAHDLVRINKNRPLAARLGDLFFAENREEVANLLDNLGGLDEEFGLYEASVISIKRALEICEALFEKEDDRIAEKQNNLALVYRKLGRYEAAVALFEAALASGLKNFGDGHPNVAIRESNLANVYYDLGKHEKARDLLEAALTSDLKNFGDGHPNVGVDQSSLALVYRDLGEHEKARDLLEAALASALKNFGDGHPNLATHQSNLALVYLNLEEHEKARDLLKAALASDLKNFGDGHPNVAIDQSILALVYRDLGEHETARDLLEAALTSDLKNFGDGHPNVAAHQLNLAAVYVTLDRKAEAKTLLAAAYRTFLKTLGSAHPSTVRAQEWLAEVE